MKYDNNCSISVSTIYPTYANKRDENSSSIVAIETDHHISCLFKTLESGSGTSKCVSCRARPPDFPSNFSFSGKVSFPGV